ncbi:MAG: hypothetical protein IKM44_01710 [Clostridia bacterium]|nr:hypothetical protein [Clostridia bacterium]
MSEENKNEAISEDVYDTTIYTDFFDLPMEKKQALYNEYLKTNKKERKLSLMIFLSPLLLYVVAIGLMIACFAVALVNGIGLPFIILTVSTAVVLTLIIIMRIKLNKVKRALELRFADWLKVEKKIIAELVEK